MPQRRKTGRLRTRKPMERAQEKMDAMRDSKTVKDRVRKKDRKQKQEKGLDRYQMQNPFAKIEVDI